jgi:signal transduction histidine kinase
MTTEPALSQDSAEKLLEALADLERARKYEHQLRMETEGLLEGLRALNSAQNTRQVFNNLIDVLHGFVPFEHAFMLRRGSSDGLTCFHATASSFLESFWVIGDMLQRVIQGEIVAVFDVNQVPEWMTQPAILRLRVKSAVHLSLRAKSLTGCLVLVHSEPAIFNKRHAHFLKRFAPLTDQALTNIEYRERLEAERTVAEMAKDRADRANLAKSKFLAAASHDLRQPFQAMALYLSILESRMVDPFGQKAVAGLGSAITAGQDLLNALLDISTLEAGVTMPSLEVVSLESLFPSLTSEFLGFATKQGIALRCVATSAQVYTDPVLFGRMLRNLLSNALKYTRTGKVLLGCRRSGNSVRVEVWDTGQGVPSERQEEIWEEFIQLHNPARDRSRGLGLGLAIVAKTGKLLGHPVGIRSNPGKGSVFYVTLPAVPAACPVASFASAPASF